jgi:hypothetical protein
MSFEAKDVSQKNFWDSTKQSSWVKIPYPWKPNYLDLFFFTFHIIVLKIKIKKPTVLLVGCTKELRTILNLFHVKYDLIDFSHTMKEITAPKNDFFLNDYIQSEWTTSLQKKYNYYSLIVGDLVLNLLSEKDTERVVNNCKNYLTTKGKLVLRTRVLTKETADKLLVKFTRQIKTLNKKTFYFCFANYQTLYKIREDEACKIVFAENKRNTFLENFILYFINSPLQYFIFDQKKIESFFDDEWEVAWYSTQLYKKTFDDYFFIVAKKL